MHNPKPLLALLVVVLVSGCQTTTVAPAPYTDLKAQLELSEYALSGVKDRVADFQLPAFRRAELDGVAVCHRQTIWIEGPISQYCSLGKHCLLHLKIGLRWARSPAKPRP